MLTVKGLCTQAKQFGLPGTSKLCKAGLNMVIAQAHATKFQERVERVVRRLQTGRFSALLENPSRNNKKG